VLRGILCGVKVKVKVTSGFCRSLVRSGGIAICILFSIGRSRVGCGQESRHNLDLILNWNDRLLDF
jgi:hypothetical protein